MFSKSHYILLWSHIPRFRVLKIEAFNHNICKSTFKKLRRAPFKFCPFQVQGHSPIAAEKHLEPLCKKQHRIQDSIAAEDFIIKFVPVWKRYKLGRKQAVLKNTFLIEETEACND